MYKKIKICKNYILLNLKNTKKLIKYDKISNISKLLLTNFIKIIIIFFILYIFKINFYYNKCNNNINSLFYENNIDYSNYLTDIKAIAIYFPNFYSINESYFYSYKYYNTLIFLKKVKPIFKGHHQPRIIDKKYINNYNLRTILKKQIKLAKSHGIYGFAIYYYWFSGRYIFDKPLNAIYKNKENFHYMLIWKNEKVINENNETILEEKYEVNDSEKFIKDIKKYLIDKLYIRANGKPIIGIYNIKAIPNLRETILKMRKKSKEFKIGEIFIISCLNGLKINEINNMNVFDGAYKLPPKDLKETKIKNKRDHYTYYYSLVFSNIMNDNKIENFPIYEGNMLEFDNSAITQNKEIFGEYSPELFYKINKLLIKNLKEENNEESNRFIFINAWNNYYEGTYLEPDERYGYGSINALSKSLFNLPFKSQNYKLSNLMNNCLVAVHAHIFYKDLVKEIINKTNNIPIKFDLYISTDTKRKMQFIKNYVDIYSKANNVYIQIFENKGRDILPFLIQMGKVIDKYKYLCHLHSKKSLYSPRLGKNWRIYLFNNLLGKTEIISEILSDFESYDKLGFIYPENYYKILKDTMFLRYKDKERMKYLFSKIFPGYKFSDKKYFDFPAGDMFWARTKAIYQIFKIDLRHDIPREKGSKYILYAIERFWLFIVKINGYYYKKYYNYYK